VTESTSDPLVYKDGAIDVPHWGITLRAIFGAALQHHDIMEKGRNVTITLKGVKIGQIQLKDSAVGQGYVPPVIRKNTRRV